MEHAKQRGIKGVACKPNKAVFQMVNMPCLVKPVNCPLSLIKSMQTCDDAAIMAYRCRCPAAVVQPWSLQDA